MICTEKFNRLVQYQFLVHITSYSQDKGPYLNITLLCPPSKKRRYIVLLMSVGRRSVRPYTKRFPDDNLRTLGPRIMKVHREVGHDLQMTPIDFEVTCVKGQGHRDLEM